jgi:hypothetical protein
LKVPFRFISNLQGKTHKRGICDIRHGNHPKAEEKVLQEVVRDVKNRIRVKRKFKKNDLNVEICRNWGIAHDVLY